MYIPLKTTVPLAAREQRAEEENKWNKQKRHSRVSKQNAKLRRRTSARDGNDVNKVNQRCLSKLC